MSSFSPRLVLVFPPVTSVQIVFYCTRRVLLTTLAAMLLFVGFASAVGAQVIPLSVLSNPSVRSVSMGETGGADATDPTNSYLNPAALPTGCGFYLSAFLGQSLAHLLGPDARLKGFHAGGGYEWEGSSAVDIGLAGQLRYARLDYGESVMTNSQGEEIGTVNPTDSYLGVTLMGHVRLWDAISVALGLTFKDWNIDRDFAGGEAPNGTTYDAGLRFAFINTSDSGWKTVIALAASVWNLNGEYQAFGSQIDFDHDANYAFSIRSDTPVRRLVTGAYVPALSLVFNTDVLLPERPNDDLVARLGFEVSGLQVLFVRFGWVIPEQSDTSQLVLGAGLGVPSKYFNVRLDFAVVPLTIVGSNADIEDRDQKASLSLNFPLPFGSLGDAPGE